MMTFDPERSARSSPEVSEVPDGAHGDLRFATTDERDEASVRLGRAGMLVAELEGVGPSARGRLAELIAETIERELAARGEASPGLLCATNPDALLSDQLFRARRSGATGIAVVLGPLRAATGALGALDPSDSATLRFLATATRERPVTVLLDARDTQTSAFGDPVALGALLMPAVVAPAPGLSASTQKSAADVPESPRTDTTWRTWTLQLAAARGPQPIAALEQLFADAYVPLANAVVAGLEDPRARRARDDFRDTFAAGYVESFHTFAATTKRPRMVLDVHDVAGRVARLHGARTMRLLLVDAMRWDLSRAIQGRLAAKLGARAAIADEILLWSALPTTTNRQLETIARGVDALRAPSAVEPEGQPLRGRNAEHVRRMRVGPRELNKLDIVESRLHEARGEVMRELPEIAEVTAEAVARYVETLAPRTLLFVFGDHGFTIDKNGVACQGGASPEEVLVGGFGLLVGEVH